MSKKCKDIEVEPIPGPWKMWQVGIHFTYSTKREAIDAALKEQKRLGVKHVLVVNKHHDRNGNVVGNGPKNSFTVSVIPPIMMKIKD